MHNCLRPAERCPLTPTTRSAGGSGTDLRRQLIGPGIFPTCSRPADVQPQDLQCDHQQFKNYPGVEEQDITDKELSAHLEKGHVAACDSFGELSDFVDGEPTLSKIGLIAKTRNGVTNARNTLDTQQSGVEHVTAQAQRVTLSRLFDAILQLVFPLTCVAAGVRKMQEAVEAFVLVVADAFRRTPHSPS